MISKYIKNYIIYFIISYTLVFGIIFLISYNFFINDFISLEKIQNKSNIKTFLNNINNDLKNLKNITEDYSKWDDAYTFIEGKNEEFIYENFREGSGTLGNLNIDTIIYLNFKNKVTYSTYSNKNLEDKKKNFESFLINKFKEKQNLDTIINYDSTFLYFSKKEIQKSDRTGDSRGYLITIKSLNDIFFDKSYTIFKDIKINNEKTLTNDLKLDLSTLKNVKIKFDTTSNKIINYIQFFDYNDKYIISIIVSNPRDIVNNGEETIYMFNLIVSIILFLFFLFFFKNQYLIQTQNDTLNKEVEKRTGQLDKALRKVNDKNKELYTLANIDSLTKIRNRRCFFIDSNQALKKVIKNKETLCILMIDIDNFKSVNDTYGHAIGDEVLIKLSAIVNSVIDDETIFGRIGGEEFCITFYNKSLDEVTNISQEIRNKCANTLIEINNYKFKFTVSMGLSCNGNLTDIDKILNKSDELLYEAKKSGKNRLVRVNRLNI
ncbi:diguanylate cyclase [Poseidonibacter lekithochrous]|uniref:sensor domain-containing diguanylate cyclase n=1 Tax=Poseidonibacter TaxID=2321187 RepID=UPI001C09948B|nr:MULTISPECIES: diguanylate cyclase [Poseidonibacter]MBU3014989.1 diguanylate cyclase [Poseidonibacter lekithochrous]MDO6828286.1 diguanylate cyclase [Poseidonibacter sp. 1_MG-2023]